MTKEGVVWVVSTIGRYFLYISADFNIFFKRPRPFNPLPDGPLASPLTDGPRSDGT